MSTIHSPLLLLSLNLRSSISEFSVGIHVLHPSRWRNVTTTISVVTLPIIYTQNERRNVTTLVCQLWVQWDLSYLLEPCLLDVDCRIEVVKDGQQYSHVSGMERPGVEDLHSLPLLFHSFRQFSLNQFHEVLDVS